MNANTAPHHHTTSHVDRPIIIIGAGRSGTNMLRDILVTRSEFVTWPCDEINYIWRHGNRGHATDQFTRDMADEKTKRFIRRQFESFRRRSPHAQLIEKTCANSLRCEFVHEVFPQAKFIHLIRDGRDVAASATLRWNAKLDVPYLVKKAKYVPWSDLPYYGSKYMMARMYRLFSGKKRLSTWGPRFKGMESVFREHQLPVGCAIQWRECVEAAMKQLSEIDQGQVLTLKYESLASDAAMELKKTFQFLGVDVEDDELSQLAKHISSSSVGKWRSQFNDLEIEKIETNVGPLLKKLGYL